MTELNLPQPSPFELPSAPVYEFVIPEQKADFIRTFATDNEFSVSDVMHAAVAEYNRFSTCLDNYFRTGKQLFRKPKDTDGNTPLPPNMSYEGKDLQRFVSVFAVESVNDSPLVVEVSELEALGYELIASDRLNMSEPELYQYSQGVSIDGRSEHESALMNSGVNLAVDWAINRILAEEQGWRLYQNPPSFGGHEGQRPERFKTFMLEQL